MLLMLEDNIIYQPGSRLRKCGNLCSVLTATFCFLAIMTILAIFATDLTQRVHVVYVNTGKRPVFRTDKKFLSIALDTSIIASGFQHLDLTNQKLKKLVSALTPCYLRIGGTMSDRLTFSTSKSFYFKHLSENFDGGECANAQKYCDYLQYPNFTMNAHEWLKLNEFAKKTGAVLIFDLNALKRFDNGSWNYGNAEKLIGFSSNYNLDVNWELGNEPNAFRRQFNYDVTPTQMAKDFQTLRKILKKYPKYSNSLLVGPDVTRPQTVNNASEIYLKDFLPGAGHIIDAVTWHQYYFNGATATVGDFLDPENFDLLLWQINTIKNIVKSQGVDKPLWLGETSSAYGGGAPHLSNRYIATFLWLDKLGISAKSGLSVVIRQSIFHGHYALIDSYYNPTPDLWVSILYKKLVGNKVVDCSSSNSEKLRLYCHCTNRKTYYGKTRFVTVFGINIDNRKMKIRFEGISHDDSDRNLKVDAYVLTTVHRIDSRFIYLNDQRLHLTSTDDVPNLLPKTITANPYVEMPAYSLAFWVIPVTNSAVPYC